MHDLTAQVTSSLLPFSGVTVDALGEDEISLDCVLHGKFTIGKYFYTLSLIDIFIFSAIKSVVKKKLFYEELS